MRSDQWRANNPDLPGLVGPKAHTDGEELMR